jgi:hypothetical protein
MLEAVQDALQEIGGMLGFDSDGIAWAYIGCILASLLCVIYGLTQWSRGGERSRRGKRITKGKRPKRRR